MENLILKSRNAGEVGTIKDINENGGKGYKPEGGREGRVV